MTLKFTTLNDNADPTFNQLLGINNEGKIAGYFGSDAAPNFPPNKGYTLSFPYGQGNYTNENFLGSVQTQVTGINDQNVTVVAHAASSIVVRFGCPDGLSNTMHIASMPVTNFYIKSIDLSISTACSPLQRQGERAPLARVIRDFAPMV